MLLLCEPDNRTELLGETIGYAIIDSGCTSTVCGSQWLDTYLDTLSNALRRTVHVEPSRCPFRFGDGEIYTSNRVVDIPVFFGSQSARLRTDVVVCDIPLLLSRVSLKRADCHLDFTNDKIYMFGEEIPITISKSGHYCVPLIRGSSEHSSVISQVLYSSPLQSDDDEGNHRKILKLHKQFAHPAPERLKKLIRNAGIDSVGISAMVDSISQNCDVCKRFKKPPPRPVVGFPTASEFNETVAMDLKVINQHFVLHMIDHATRYSTACLLRNKKAETIISAVMSHWIRIFGSPTQFLTDNGGEFVNSVMLELAETFNITLKTTAAESAWSNGLCERHNAVLGDLVAKTQADSRCSLELAIPWAIAAKNALSNVFGFSPNQLVFGRNIGLPAVHNDRMPARPTSSSEYITRNLIALHQARQAFVSQESCEKLRRALNKQTRTYSNTVFHNGDSVYYKRQNSAEWHGPARVLGRDGAQFLLKHGGIYIRVHPCKMQLVNPSLADRSQHQAEDDRHPVVSDDTTEPGVNLTEDSDEEDKCPIEALPPSPPPTPAFPPPPVLPQIAESPVEHSQNDTMSSPKSTISPAPAPASDKPTIPRALARLQDYNKPPLDQPDFSDPSKSTDTEDVLFGQATNSARFDSAKAQELEKWRDMGAYTEVDDIGQPRVSTRWVCTEKMKGGKLNLKARLVARGFEEDTSQLKSDSPTCHKESLRLLLCILASKGWELHSIDIKSAYLQGCPIGRVLFLQPPKCANTTKIWKLQKTPYGLVDAGRQWYIRIVKEFTDLGARQATCDQAVFIWQDQSVGEPYGIIVAHVDDFMYGGNDQFHREIVPRIRSRFTVGLEESHSLKYLGLNISQSSRAISLSTNSYSTCLKEIDTTVFGVDKGRSLTSEEISVLKSVAGQINWLASQSRPDVAFDSCIIGNSTKNPTVSDIHRTNKALRKVRGQDVSLLYPASLDLTTCQLISFCDASYANLPDRGSQGGFIIFLIDGKGMYCPITWQSKRIKRVVNSTLAAECLAAVEAADTCILWRALLEEFLCLPSGYMKISVLCDNRSLVDAVHSSTSVENKRLQIDVSILREMVKKGELYQFKWLDTKHQVANALTKSGASADYLLTVLKGTLIYDHNNGTFA